MALPIIALVGGVWAYARPDGANLTGGLPSDVLPEAAAALALVIGGWLPLWHALTRTQWASVLQSWRGWTEVDPLPRWPYLQTQTPGAALHRRLGQALAWWRRLGRAALVVPLRRALLSVVVSVLLGLALGREALLLSAILLALAELATLWHEGIGKVSASWEATALVGLPWLLGSTLQHGMRGAAALSAAALTVLVAFYAHPAWSAMLGPVVGALFLVSQGEVMAAGWLVLLAIPGLMVLVYAPQGLDYRRAVAPWIMAIVALMAWVL
jgi:hypothetical protein